MNTAHRTRHSGLRVRTIALALGLASLVGAVTNPSTASAQSVLASARATSVAVTAHQGLGTPASTQQSFLGSQWTFYSNGTMSVSPNPAFFRSDLIPLVGTYQIQGNVLRFSVSRQVRIGGTGSAYARLYGTMQDNQGQSIGTATLEAGAGNGAVVNGARFAGAQTKVDQFQFAIA